MKTTGLLGVSAETVFWLRSRRSFKGRGIWL